MNSLVIVDTAITVNEDNLHATFDDMEQKMLKLDERLAVIESDTDDGAGGMSKDDIKEMIESEVESALNNSDYISEYDADQKISDAISDSDVQTDVDDLKDRVESLESKIEAVELLVKHFKKVVEEVLVS